MIEPSKHPLWFITGQGKGNRKASTSKALTGWTGWEQKRKLELGMNDRHEQQAFWAEHSVATGTFGTFGAAESIASSPIVSVGVRLAGTRVRVDYGYSALNEIF